MTDARRLKHRIGILRLSDSQDAAGQPGTWVDLINSEDGKIAADVRHLSGLETIKAGSESSAVKASIRIRYRTDVTADMRAVHGSTVYQIKAVMQDMAYRRYTDLACEIVT
jgi:SPP1 family predicted phage head-tail adaptor